MSRKITDLSKVIWLLERLSLVDFANQQGIKRLEEAVKFSEKIQEVDTTGVEPMIWPTVEGQREGLYLRDDKTIGTSKLDATGCASKMVEDYFVAPPGNIPLKTKGFEDYN